MRKHTIEEIKNYVQENSESILISDEYLGVKVKMNFLCKCGGAFVTNMSEFKHGNKRRCNPCSGKTDWNHKMVKEFIEQNSHCKLIQDKFAGTKEKLKLMCGCGELFETHLDTFRKSSGRHCKNCRYKEVARKNTHPKDSFTKKVKDLVGNEYTVMGEYIGVDTHILMRHNICGNEWETTPDKFSGKKQGRCPKCRGGVRKTHEQFVDEVKILGLGEYVVLGNYINCETNIEIKHLTCGLTFKPRPNDFVNSGNRCSVCTVSRGEKDVQTYLRTKNIHFEQQYKLKDCKVKRALPFDFAVFDDNGGLKCLIEYDGEGHYKPFRYSKDKDVMLKKLQTTLYNDAVKTEYCESNGIKLIRIPYTEKDTQSYLEKQLSIL